MPNHAGLLEAKPQRAMPHLAAVIQRRARGDWRAEHRIDVPPRETIPERDPGVFLPERQRSGLRPRSATRSTRLPTPVCLPQQQTAPSCRPRAKLAQGAEQDRAVDEFRAVVIHLTTSRSVLGGLNGCFSSEREHTPVARRWHSHPPSEAAGRGPDRRSGDKTR